MVETTQPPRRRQRRRSRRQAAATARQLPRGLYVAAQRSRDRPFHALYDRIHRGDVLAEAWVRTSFPEIAGTTALQRAGRAVGLRLLEHLAQTLPGAGASKPGAAGAANAPAADE